MPKAGIAGCAGKSTCRRTGFRGISLAKRNVVESRAFSQRLEEAVARYHANAISTVEMIQTLIDLAKDVKASAARGDAEGLSDEELAFYDALAQNETAVEAVVSQKWWKFEGGVISG